MNELITVENGAAILVPEIAEKIAEFERMAKDIKTKEDELRKAILEEMEAKGIAGTNNEVEGIAITYVAPAQRETFDSKSFRAANPDLYDEYVTFTDVKSSIRIKLK